MNAASAFAFKVSLADHRMTVIAKDGTFCQPFIVEEYIVMAIGERYDVLVRAGEDELEEFSRCLCENYGGWRCQFYRGFGGYWVFWFLGCR